MVEEIASSSESMQSESQELWDLVETFELGEEATTKPAPKRNERPQASENVKKNRPQKKKKSNPKAADSG